jgi:hypothetical protein
MRRMLIGIVMLSALAPTPSFACGPTKSSATTSSIPPLAATLDRALVDASLPASEMQTLKALRAEIASLAARHKMDAARAAEERAMKMLGYSKMWSLCGPGTFLWMKQSSDIEALHQSSAKESTL